MSVNVNFHLPGVMYQGLKSTQQKQKRQEERDNKIAYFEKQKENLKNMKGGSLEEIARKLELFHSYQDQIAAAKAAYNQEQMHHVMDEAEEIGEKLAKAAKKNEPKTERERKEELAEKISGTEGEKDGLLELLEEVTELPEEVMPENVWSEEAAAAEDVAADAELSEEAAAHEELPEAFIQENRLEEDGRYRRIDILA